MLRVSAEEFVEASKYLAGLHTIAVAVAQQPHGKRPLTPSEREAAGLVDRLEGLRSHCEALNMRLTIKHINRCLNTDEITPLDLQAFSNEIYQRFRDELAERRFFSLRESCVQLYEEPLRGWDKAVAAFPSAVFDITEAAKCFAVERYTASVFHQMRSLEGPLAVISKDLGVVKKSPTWNAYLEAFKDAAKAKYPNPHGPDKDKRDYFSGLEAQLRAIKDTYRNPTMHELAQSYTPEEAQGAFDLTRAFFLEASRELRE